MSTETTEILFETRGHLGIATLNRPRALNAQNLAMVQAFLRQLRLWEADPAVTTLLIRGAGTEDRVAFCAGGDVKVLWSQPPEARQAFFDYEYDLCAALKETRLTTVAYMDGITMGGGVGLSIYANHRLATPLTRWAMPEMRLGFFLDIAASHFLNTVTDPILGRYLALTGAHLDGADCVAAGIATAFVATGQGDALAEALTVSPDVDSALGAFAVPAEESNLPAFEAGSLEQPLPAFLAQVAGQGLLPDGLCSLSLKVMDEALRRGRTQDYAATVAMDKRVVARFLAGKTFPEGVRALLIDRDNQPDWAEIPLESITDAEVQGYFTPLFTDSSAHATILAS